MKYPKKYQKTCDVSHQPPWKATTSHKKTQWWTSNQREMGKRAGLYVYHFLFWFGPWIKARYLGFFLKIFQIEDINSESSIWLVTPPIPYLKRLFLEDFSVRKVYRVCCGIWKYFGILWSTQKSTKKTCDVSDQPPWKATTCPKKSNGEPQTKSSPAPILRGLFPKTISDLLFEMVLGRFSWAISNRRSGKN